MELTTYRWVRVPDMNSQDCLFGGAMLAWVDQDASYLTNDLVEIKNYSYNIVTIGVHNSKFMKPVRLGERLSFHYKLAHISNSTLTIAARVKNHVSGEHVFFAFIAFALLQAGSVIGIRYLMKNPEFVEGNFSSIEHTSDWKFVEDYRDFIKGRKHE
jgi:acyl-CoA thioesterase FadM